MRNEYFQYLQIKASGANYFTDPWNYIDSVPPVMVLLIAIMNVLKINTQAAESIESIMKSLGSLFMWLKLLYFLRIYPATGYLVRMIVQVIQEMKVFLLFLLITIIAVSDAQISIQENDKELDPARGFFDFLWKNFKRFIASVYTTYDMILGGNGFTPQTQF